MIDIDKYLDNLCINQNIGADKSQRNLYTRKDYFKLLKEVLEIIINNKDLSIEELRGKIYANSGLEELLRDFFLKRKMAPGAVISFGTKNYQERIIIGNKQEVLMKDERFIPLKEEMTEDTIFDLASVTKMFTSLCILKLLELGELNLNDELVKYEPRFINLKGITLFDLLTFEPLITDKKIDSTNDYNEALEILFRAKRKEVMPGFGIYNDIAPMALKFVIDNISGMSYQDFLKREILDKIEMKDTYVKIPNEKVEKVANSNYDGRIYKDGNYLIRTKALKGISTDDKARILGQPEGNLSGHAGLFSTSSDMTKLARALIDEKILNIKIRDEMARNRRGYAFMQPDGTKNYAQYFGMLVYSKNPKISSTEVQHMLSGKSFAGAGWTGTQITIDPINNLNFTLLSNRSHNRMTYIDESLKDRIITHDNGYRSIILPNGLEMIDATRYAWERDNIIRKSLELVFKYKMLEDITGYCSSIIEENKFIK